MGRASRQGLVMKKSSRSDWKLHILNGLLHLNECIAKSIGQLAGYLSRPTFKKHNCEAYHSQLVRRVHLEVTALHLGPMEAAFQSWRLEGAWYLFVRCSTRNDSFSLQAQLSSSLNLSATSTDRQLETMTQSMPCLAVQTSEKRSSLSPYGSDKTIRKGDNDSEHDERNCQAR